MSHPVDTDQQQIEARREQHWREAEIAACACFSSKPIAAVTLHDVTHALLALCFVPDADFNHRQLDGFHAEYGTPALLRVIANALEGK